MKEKWQRPQLVVLYKGKPEENVLCGCKYSSSGGGPTPSYSGCDKQTEYHSSRWGGGWWECAACQYGTAS